MKVKLSTVQAIAVFVAVLCLMLGAASSCSGLLDQAEKAAAEGHTAEAAALYRASLDKDPDNLEALRGLAVALYLNKSFDEALPIQEKVVDLDATDVQTRIELGFNYLAHQGRPADAANVLGEAASLDPSAKNLTYWAQALIACGEEARAEEVLRKAIETEPGYAHSYEVLYRLLCSQGRIDEAQRLLGDAAAQGVVVNDSPAR